MQGGRKQYGLQLQIRGPPKKPAVRPPPSSAFRFNDGDDDEGDVGADIARQAKKKRSEVDQQLVKALEEDPSAFDYDGVYEEMKGNQARPIHEDRAKREPKYIGKLLEKAKVRAREQDVVYERQLGKERAKEDHLYGDKEKFVTGAYKSKLQEQARWSEEERRRELEEEKHVVTNKSDMSDFYRNLLNSNVAFGGRTAPKPSDNPAAAAKVSGPESQIEDAELMPSTSSPGLDAANDASEQRPPNKGERNDRSGTRDRSDSRSVSRSRDGGNSIDMKDQEPHLMEKPAASTAEVESTAGEEGKLPPKGGAVELPKQSSVDPVAAAKERYLARKRQRGT